MWYTVIRRITTRKHCLQLCLLSSCQVLSLLRCTELQLFPAPELSKTALAGSLLPGLQRVSTFATSHTGAPSSPSAPCRPPGHPTVLFSPSVLLPSRPPDVSSSHPVQPSGHPPEASCSAPVQLSVMVLGFLVFGFFCYFGKPFLLSVGVFQFLSLRCLVSVLCVPWVI